MTAPVLQGLDAAIIDLDGTMVDTLGDFAQALGAMLDDLGLPGIEPAFIAQMVGKGSEHLLRSVLNHVLDASRASARCYQNRSVLSPRLGELPAALPGHQRAVIPASTPACARACWRCAARGLRLACLTNKPTSFALPLLRAKGLDGFFEHVFGGDAFERKKPDPLPILKTCAALGTLPARTLMVGDSSNDAAGRARRRLPGGAGHLRLQPRPAGARGGCRLLRGRAARTHAQVGVRAQVARHVVARRLWAQRAPKLAPSGAAAALRARAPVEHGHCQRAAGCA